jgi:hypothetical protein
MIVKADRTGSIEKVVTKRPVPRRPSVGTVPAALAAAVWARLNDCQNRQNRKYCESRYKTPIAPAPLGGDCPRRFGGGGLWVGRMIVRTDRTGSIVKVVTKPPGSPATPQRGLSPPLWRRQFGGRLNDCQNRQNRKDCENRYKSPGSPATPRRGLSPPLWRRQFGGG